MLVSASVRAHAHMCACVRVRVRRPWKRRGWDWRQGRCCGDLGFGGGGGGNLELRVEEEEEAGVALGQAAGQPPPLDDRVHYAVLVPGSGTRETESVITARGGDGEKMREREREVNALA